MLDPLNGAQYIRIISDVNSIVTAGDGIRGGHGYGEVASGIIVVERLEAGTYGRPKQPQRYTGEIELDGVL